MSKVFISYRRDNSADAADRIYARLVNEFGRTNVFKDVEDIPLGSDFRVALRDAVGECSITLVIIGRDWVTTIDVAGRRRLDDPTDFVRIEVEAALARNIPVIPVLVQGVDMPREGDLPPSMAGLAYRNGFTVRPDPYFRGDADALIERLYPLFNTRRIDLVAFHKLGDALRASDVALQRDPNDPSAWTNKGIALNTFHSYEEALAAYDCALAIDPNFAPAWTNKGIALNRLGRYEEALDACDWAIVLDPGSALAWASKASALAFLQRYQEALASFGCALARDPALKAAWEGGADVLRALGRTEEAEDAERRAKALGG